MNLSSYTWWKQKKKKERWTWKEIFCLGAALLVSCGGSKSATLDEVKSPEMVYGMSAVVGVEESLSGMAINPMSANDGDDEHDQDLQAIEEVTDLDLLMGLMNDDLFTVEKKEMTGILIYQNVTYQFKSEEEIEADESEIKVTIYENDYNDRLEIEKEFEDGEYQYTYKLYRNDDEYLSVELEVEESEMELIIKKKN